MYAVGGSIVRGFAVLDSGLESVGLLPKLKLTPGEREEALSPTPAQLKGER